MKRSHPIFKNCRGIKILNISGHCHTVKVNCVDLEHETDFRRERKRNQRSENYLTEVPYTTRGLY